MKYIAMTAALLGLMWGSIGCSEEKSEAPAEPAAEAPAPAPEAAPAEPEEPAKPKVSKAAERRQRLEASFAALYCAQLVLRSRAKTR